MYNSNTFRITVFFFFFGLITFEGYSQVQKSINTKMTASSEDCNIVLFANQANATYQWIDCGSGVDIEGATKRKFRPKKDGTYSVRIKLDSLQGVSDCLTVEFEGSGNTTKVEQWDEEPIEGLNIKIYPTENDGTLIVEIVGERSGSYRMEIFDVTGKSIKKMALPRAKNTLLMAGSPKGDYEAKITSSKYGRTTVKFRVE